ncbi:hypothetical protein FHR75_004051 [Kineococcus radiotolerans]|uniref:Uncharacterized protein n=1 Tax=Kineococcus radiotolerans TaxID=131568 RepID=A0A7W4TQF3_KINRA|nr:hypothetical protein [Kineococcus radiotolerans]
MGHQGDVAEVVGAELQLEAVDGRLTLRRGHDPRVVDEQVDGLAFFLHPGPEGGDRGEGGQVKIGHHYPCAGHRAADRRQRGSALDLIANRKGEVRAGGGQPAGQSQAHAITGTGDYGVATDEGGNIDVGTGTRHCLLQVVMLLRTLVR